MKPTTPSPDTHTHTERSHPNPSLPSARSTPSLDALEPVLHLVNSSVVESIARAAAGLNLTLLDEAARRRGNERAEESEVKEGERERGGKGG